LLASLSRINYPADKYEVIIVNDNSEDNTYRVAQEFCSTLSNFSVINSEVQKNLKAKRAALTTGINKSRYEYLLITDADCEAPPNWLRCYSTHFKNFDFVFGIAPYRQTGGLINKISCFENLKNHFLLFTFAKLGVYYSATARNMGFRKSAFERLNGYISTTDTLSGDDDLLIREAVKNKLKIGCISSRQAWVYSSTKESPKQYINQKARHTSSSHYYLPSQKLLLALWHLSNVVVLFSFLLSFYNSIFVLPIIIKLTVDYLITNANQNKFGYDFNPAELFALPIIYEVMIVTHYFNSFRFKSRWE
jgi:cellulose synthase/poly-beta-1,6-N-acetylglucosamine synthase-like glycosyltransferase